MTTSNLRTYLALSLFLAAAIAACDDDKGSAGAGSDGGLDTGSGVAEMGGDRIEHAKAVS